MGLSTTSSVAKLPLLDEWESYCEGKQSHCSILSYLGPFPLKGIQLFKDVVLKECYRLPIHVHFYLWALVSVRESSAEIVKCLCFATAAICSKLSSA